MEMFERSEIYLYKMSNVFMHLFLGLILAGIVSYVLSTNEFLLKYYSSFIIMWMVVSMILIFAIGFFARNKELSTLIYYVFCALEGLALAPIFLIYTGTSIALAFLATGFVCLVLSIYAKNTSHDFKNYGFILMIATLVGIIISIINYFIFHSSLLSTVLNLIFVILFSFWFVYDIQTADELIRAGYSEAAIALSLFIDFVGIFMNLLQLFGEEK